MAHFNKALDEIRAEEARQLNRDGYEPVLKHSRRCLLKRPANLTAKQVVKMAEFMKYNLRLVRAHLLREEFQRFWESTSAGWARRFFDEWCNRTIRSRLDPMKRVARMLQAHRTIILNWFRARVTMSAEIVEGFNNKAKLTTKKAYGFRTHEAIEIALEDEKGERHRGPRQSPFRSLSSSWSNCLGQYDQSGNSGCGVPKSTDYFERATPGVLVCAYCGKSKVNTSGSVPVFSISTPPFSSAA